MEQNEDISKELHEISSLLYDLGKRNVYHVPEGYFETLPQQILEKIHNKTSSGNDLNAEEEIMAISPLLAGLKNKQTFAVPGNYFDQIAGVVSAEVVTNKTHTATPVYNINTRGRKWMRYAAAAIVTGGIGISAFFFANRHSAVNEIVAKTDLTTAGSGLKDISDAILSDYLADMPESRNTLLDSSDADFYNTAFMDINDKDLADMIHQIPDDDLFSYQDDIQKFPVSL